MVVGKVGWGNDGVDDDGSTVVKGDALAGWTEVRVAANCDETGLVGWTGTEAAHRRSSSIVSKMAVITLVSPALVLQGFWACWRKVVSWLRIC